MIPSLKYVYNLAAVGVQISFENRLSQPHKSLPLKTEINVPTSDNAKATQRKTRNEKKQSFTNFSL